AEAIEATVWESLRQKLEWHYPFAAATTEPAKTSVSALRRRLREETDDEANPLFRASSFKSHIGSRSRDVIGKLSAAEVGTAHHLFLQLVPLERASSRLELKEEAERLSRAAILSAVEVARVDVVALLAVLTLALGW